MEYFSFEQERTLLFVTLTYVSAAIIAAWVFFISMEGFGMWEWLNPGRKRKPETDMEDEQPFDNIEPLDFEAIFAAARRNNREKFVNAFLGKGGNGPLHNVHISRQTSDKITGYLPLIDPGLSLNEYLDNIVAHHIGHYEDVISELCNEKSQNPD